jgi:hypothetical protein
MRWGALDIPVELHHLGLFSAIALLPIFVFVRQEVRRANRRFLPARISAVAVAVLSLMLVALQPRWLVRSKPTEALLITPGADSQTVRAPADSINASLVFSLDGLEKWRSIFPQAQTIPDVAYLKRHHPEVRFVHVLGFGLNDYDWAELDSVSIKLHASPLPLGIKWMDWKRELVAGERLRVSGIVTGLDGQEHMLYLTDPGGVVDSVKVSAKGDARFEFTATPHESGRFLYEIIMRSNDNDILFREKISVNVVEPQPLRILLLENSVSFETRHLKNWLGKNRNRLAIRSTISRDRYRFEFQNHPQVDLKVMSSDLLDRFDLAIIDSRTLSLLSTSERKTLRAAVERKGLGVLIRPDEVVLSPNQQRFSDHGFFLNFRFEEFPELEYRMIRPFWFGLHDSSITKIPAEPFAIQPDWGMKPLVNDEMERTIAAAYRRGQGQVAISLIRDSYRWILEGNAQHHAAYWSHIFSELARKNSYEDRWAITSKRPSIIDQPVQFVLATISLQPIGLLTTEEGAQDSIFLRQDIVHSQRWFGTFWPKETGWHSIATVNGNSFWFYVYEKNYWQIVQQAQKVEATKRFVMQNPREGRRDDHPAARTPEAIPLFSFFLAFLLASTFLWIERKL